MKAFTAALDSLGKDPFSIGKLPPTPGVVDEYYNDSTGDGENGKDGLGSWIEQNGLHVVEWLNNPAKDGQAANGNGHRIRKTATIGKR